MGKIRGWYFEKSGAKIGNREWERKVFIMTEEEKIFAGKMFDPRKQELKDIKHKAHIACQKYNAMDEYDPERSPIIQEFIGKIGKVYYFQGPIQFNYGSHTFIGENFFANFNLTVMDDARIYIGDNVCFGPNVSLMATSHPLIAQERMGLDDEGKPPWRNMPMRFTLVTMYGSLAIPLLLAACILGIMWSLVREA